MKIYICPKCYTVYGCQENGEPKLTECDSCHLYLDKDMGIGTLPCEAYCKATEVTKNLTCCSCIEQRLAKEN